MKVVLLLSALFALSLPTPAQESCSVAPPYNPSPAQRALDDRNFDEAQRLFAAQPPSAAATAGIVRVLLGQRKLDEALALIEKEVAAHPSDALLLDILGEVRFRRGEVVEAANAYTQSLKIDGCLARTHYDAYRFKHLYGLYGSAQAELSQAFGLDRNDPLIRNAFLATQRVPLTADQRIAELQKSESNGDLTVERKQAIENTIKQIQAQKAATCQLPEPVSSATIPMFATNPYGNDRPPTKSSVDIYLNGKRRRFTVDTGASGLLISSNAVKALGLTAEAETLGFGIGDSGVRSGFLTHVDSLKMGNLEFHNCLLRVYQSKPGVSDDVLEGGLLGPDLFHNYLVTLDMPGRELRLSPLPKRPADPDTKPSITIDADASEDASSESLTIARLARDRYIAPEMAKWFPVFRYGHDLIVPTSIGDAPRKLFIMDTGAQLTLISPEAAREVTHVARDSSLNVHGVSGEVQKVYGTGDLMISFAGLRQHQTGGLTSIDTRSFSAGSGVEISGFIGYPLLGQLVMQIDYRDNLVHLVYTPHIQH